MIDPSTIRRMPTIWKYRGDFSKYLIANTFILGSNFKELKGEEI